MTKLPFFIDFTKDSFKDITVEGWWGARSCYQQVMTHKVAHHSTWVNVDCALIFLCNNRYQHPSQGCIICSDCVVLQSNQNYLASTVITVAFVKFSPCDVIIFWNKWFQMAGWMLQLSQKYAVVAMFEPSSSNMNTLCHCCRDANTVL